jgi:hypothetical protein
MGGTPLVRGKAFLFSFRFNLGRMLDLDFVNHVPLESFFSNKEEVL